jgi:DNA-directed RNA polymerase specialized sigma24 family protein
LPYDLPLDGLRGQNWIEVTLIPDETKADSFTDFVAKSEPRIRAALTAAHGPERGREAAADALAYGWEHWDRIRVMANPTGYLFRVGHNRAKRTAARRPVLLPGVEGGGEPWIEPKLPAALAKLPERQRTVVALLHGYQWSMAEVAELLGVSKSTVQSYAERGLSRLRRRLGVEL